MHSTDSRAEGGFGIIEIVVSMLLLGLMAMAFLPLLVQSLRVSVTNTTLATATQLVAQEMEELRALESRCGSLQTYAAETNAEVSADQTLRAHISEITCPSNPTVSTTVAVRVWVTDHEDETIAQATTLVFVDN